MSDNLQQIVDEMRRHLVVGSFAIWEIAHPALPKPLQLDVIPDGVTWIVTVKCGDRSIFDGPVDPEEFVASLYVFLRAAIRAAARPTAKPN